MENKILIIDDTNFTIYLLQEYLEKFEKNKIFSATNGKEGLKLAYNIMPDLILLDITMPEMNGYEVCTHLKNSKRTKNIPVIFLSALAESFDKVKAFDVGGVDYLTKPVIQEELIARVNTHLKLSRLNISLKKKNEELEIARIEAKRNEQQIFNAIVAAQEKERTHFAAELHDGLGPLISTLKIFMQGIGMVDDAAKIKEFAKKSQVVFDEIMQTITEVSNNLSPHILHKFGLYTGIKTFIEKNVKHSGVNFIFDFNHQQLEQTVCEKTGEKCKLTGKMDEIYEITIYRIITELINNSIKHSQADEIKIKIFMQNHSLYIKYTDNGIGFDFDEILEKNYGLGLQNIQNRLKNINGTVNFTTFAGKGFSADIVIDCPLKD